MATSPTRTAVRRAPIPTALRVCITHLVPLLEVMTHCRSGHAQAISEHLICRPHGEPSHEVHTWGVLDTRTGRIIAAATMHRVLLDPSALDIHSIVRMAHALDDARQARGTVH